MKKRVLKVAVPDRKSRPRGGMWFGVLISVCIVTAVVMGYLNFIQSLRNKQIAASLAKRSSAPVAMQVPPAPSATPPPEAPPSEAVAGVKTAQVLAAGTKRDSEKAYPDKIIMVMPAENPILLDYSGDELVFNPQLLDWRSHRGIDIEGYIGMQVRAAEAGIVESVTKDPLWGNTVVVRHSDSVVSRYCGLQDMVLVKEGDRVSRNAALGGIGEVPSLELGAPPHLHFEVLENGVNIDPKSYME